MLRRASRGQATVELALALPVLILVAVAVCQVAVGLNCYLVVIAASREGARRGAETNDVVETRKAAGNASKGLPGEPAGIDVEFPEGRGRGSPIKVTVTYRMPLLIPIVSHLVPQATFKKTTCMALERGH
ncbi:MAG: pilus assembly protein [Actinobacteria bacterium]|nr:pilus assembly protein [Actinomycetota bacterium]